MISKTTTKSKNSKKLRRKMALHIKTDIIDSKRHITNRVNQQKGNLDTTPVNQQQQRYL